MSETVYKAPERVDRYSSSDVQKDLDKLIDEGTTDLVFEMTELKYISSAGLRVLLAVKQRLEDKGGSFALMNVSKSVKDLLDVTGFSGFMEIRQEQRDING